MAGVDTRNIDRDSLFLLAEVRLEGAADTHRVKVRNLSPGGMMAEGAVPGVVRGSLLTVTLRNVGPVDGSVAWVQDNRFGIAFAREVDPKAVRSPISTTPDLHTPRFVRPSTIAPHSATAAAANLRKI